MSTLTDWLDQLQQASYRGVPFGVLTNETTHGRRGELHEYPYRDTPWFEDTGRKTRGVNVRGFLVSNSQVYGGGDALDQKLSLIAAVEQQGSAKLVHPTLGELTVDGAVLSITDTDAAGYFEFQLTAYEAGLRTFPTSAASTGDAVDSAADDADTAAASDFSDAATPALSLGALAQQQVLGAVQGWTGQITGLGQTATSLISLAAGLVPASGSSFGRFVNGALQGGLGAGFLSPYSAATTIADLITGAAGQRALIASGVASVQGLAATIGLGASSTTPAQLAVAAQGLVAALAGASADPAAAVQNLTGLIGASIVVPPSVLSGSVGDLMRRAAIGALARASATYQPASYDDAANLRTTVTGLIDNEIDVAGDQGADASFDALRQLRATVALDLTTRGANLSRVQAFAIPANLPVLVLAQRLYQDQTRADDLLTQIGSACANPLFAPNAFTALAQ